MPPLLPHTRITKESDILNVHDLALQIGKWAGVPALELIRFAATVAENSGLASDEEMELQFGIAEVEPGKFFLEAGISNLSGNIQRKILQAINKHPLSPFLLYMESKKQSEETYRDMQQFTFALAHDLKNSLTKLKLALSLIESEEVPDHITNYIQIIHRAADRFETITVSLNKIIELGHSSPDVVKKISPAVVFADVQDDFADIITKSGAAINADFSMANEIHYIEVYLKSIFSNLLSNSLKYFSPHRPLRISITAQRQDGKVLITFSDNGQGIDLNASGDKLFQPFTRFSNSSEGSGIGLYLIRTFLERNGGKILVESTPGEGTTFRLVLVEYPG